MKNKELTAAELENRWKEINANEPEKLTSAEEESLSAAMAEDDGSRISFEELKEQLDGYSGRMMLRIPKSLHRDLKIAAEAEGVSLNQYMLYKLAR